MVLSFDYLHKRTLQFEGFFHFCFCLFYIVLYFIIYCFTFYYGMLLIYELIFLYTMRLTISIIYMLTTVCYNEFL